MESVVTTLNNLLTAIQLGGFVFAAVMLAVTGLMFMGGGKSKEKAQDNLKGIIIGIIILAGAATIATMIKGFSGF